MIHPALEALRGRLIVSCQARPDNPLYGPQFMAAMARAAEQGGAGGIRANGPDDIAAVRAVCGLPVIGIVKRFNERFPVYITPSLADGMAAATAGADLIALDATTRPRDGEPLQALIPALRAQGQKPVMADVSTVAEGCVAEALGADTVATTLAGYLGSGAAAPPDAPDFPLLSALVSACSVPVIAEGRYATPEQVAEAFRLGAHAVVVGTAITNPREITRRFVAAAMAGGGHG